jgi:hypothetical protein
MRTLCFVLLVASCATSSPSQEKAPPSPPARKLTDPGQVLAFHVAELVKIVQAEPDCVKSGASMVGYIDKNRAEMRGAVTQLKARTGGLSSEASEQYMASVMRLVVELVPRPMETLDEFHARCPKQDEAVSTALGSLEEAEVPSRSEK